ncbi:MAG: fasciclin domain-containing protein [Rhodobacter sp.]|nr:fasciclin domain-containing protein [Rhodobacter sp.]
MPTITGIATGDPDFSILVSTLQYLDSTLGTTLVATLDTPGADLTVFAPTNIAFADLAADLGYAGDPADTVAVTNFLVANVTATTLLDIVTYHVSPGTQLSGDISTSPTLATLNGATITPDLPTLVDNEPDLIDPSLISVDNIATNGVVHVIDKVLLPIDLPGNDAPTIQEIIETSGTGFDSNAADFDLLREAVSTAGLGGVLDDATLDLTAFAPQDGAFVGLSQALGYSGSDEAGAWAYLVEALTLLGGGDAVPLLTDVLTYHVSGESLQASQVLSSTSIGTLQGGVLGVAGTSLVDADPDVANPNIIATDIQAANGIVHVLDGVLLPADLLQSNGANDVDFVIAGDARDRIVTGADNDYADGNGGNDRMFMGSGDDVALGGSGADLMVMGYGDDVALGGSGRDRMFGQSGDDLLLGEGASDLLFGGGGDDTLEGGAGRDRMFGGSGEDVLEGGHHVDFLYGGRHDDILVGGKGSDFLAGGHGSDTFVFNFGDGHDRIFGFRSGVDQIDLSDLGLSGFEAIEDGIHRGFFGTKIDLGDAGSLFLQGLFGVRVTDDDFVF